MRKEHESEEIEICKGLSLNIKKNLFLLGEDFHPDNKKNPEAYFLLSEHFKQENFNNSEEESFFSGPSLRELNEFCYFCDFDKIINLHHIVHKSQGGLDGEDNLLPLCPNHHGMIHKRIYILQFSRGHYLLVNPETLKVEVLPTERQKKLTREFPSSSLASAIKKGKLSVTDEFPVEKN